MYFDVHVTVHHVQFLIIKPTGCTNFLNLFLDRNYMFQTVPLSIIRSFSPYTQQWCMSHRFADSLLAGSGWNMLILLSKNKFEKLVHLVPKRDDVTGEWRKLHNEELNDLYFLPNTVRVVKSRRMRWAGHVAHMGEDRGVHRVLMGKPEGKRPLGRPRCTWEDNIKMDLQKVGGGHGDWMELAQDRDRWRALVGTVRDFPVP